MAMLAPSRLNWFEPDARNGRNCPRVHRQGSPCGRPWAKGLRGRVCCTPWWQSRDDNRSRGKPPPWTSSAGPLERAREHHIARQGAPSALRGVDVAPHKARVHWNGVDETPRSTIRFGSFRFGAAVRGRRSLASLAPEAPRPRTAQRAFLPRWGRWILAGPIPDALVDSSLSRSRRRNTSSSSTTSAASQLTIRLFPSTRQDRSTRPRPARTGRAEGKRRGETTRRRAAKRNLLPRTFHPRRRYEHPAS